MHKEIFSKASGMPGLSKKNSLVHKGSDTLYINYCKRG